MQDTCIYNCHNLTHSRQLKPQLTTTSSTTNTPTNNCTHYSHSYKYKKLLLLIGKPTNSRDSLLFPWLMQEQLPSSWVTPHNSPMAIWCPHRNEHACLWSFLCGVHMALGELWGVTHEVWVVGHALVMGKVASCGELVGLPMSSSSFHICRSVSSGCSYLQECK